jgi:hypothetical protein
MVAYQTVIVGTDGSTSSFAAVERAAEVAGGSDATLVIACAYYPSKREDVEHAQDVLGEEARSSDRVAKLRIKAGRGDVVRGLKVSLEGKRQKVRRLNGRTWRARIDLRGLERGIYVVRVTATVNGRKYMHKHFYRVLYGNPRGGMGESLNKRTIVRL